MMIRNLVIVGCLLLSLGWGRAQAASASYWIMGSFSKEASAIIEKTRLEGISDFKIQIIPTLVNSRQYYRLAAPQGETAREREQQKQLLIAAKIPDPWTLQLDLPEARIETRSAKVETVNESKPMVSSSSGVIQAMASAPEKSRPPLLRTNKEYYQFCINEANAEERSLYCGNNKLGRASLFGH